MMVLSNAIGRASTMAVSSTSPTTRSNKRRVSIGTFQQMLTISSNDNNFYSDFIAPASGNDCIGALTSAASTVVSSGKWAVNMIKAAAPSLLPQTPSPSPPPPIEVATTMTSTTSTTVITGSQSNQPLTHFPQDRFADIEANIESMLPGIRSEHRRSVRLSSSSTAFSKPTNSPNNRLSVSSTSAAKVEIAAAKEAANNIVNYDDVFEQPAPLLRRGCPTRQTVCVTRPGSNNSARTIFGAIMNNGGSISISRRPSISGIEQPLANIANNSPNSVFPSSHHISKKTVMSLVARNSLQATVV